MAFVEVQTAEGVQKIRVCEYCRAVPTPSRRYCSVECQRKDEEYTRRVERDYQRDHEDHWRGD